MRETTKIQHKKPGSGKKPGEKQPCLIMIEGDFLGEVYPLTKQATILGRDDSSDILIEDNGISRRHALIEVKDRQFVLADLKSTNGTDVNGTNVTQVELQDGDKIRLGGVVLRFCFQDDIDNEYHRQLRNMAIRDGLTRIYNKRYFSESLQKEFNYAKRHNTSLSILTFDIDHFKKINDTHGHAAGDYVLKRLAVILEKGVRGYDVFARIGGEEFAFVLRGLSFQAALPFAERIRKLIDESHFAFDDKQIQVTISVGLATQDAKAPFETAEALMAHADAALYEAKQGGRNLVVGKANS